MALRTLYYDEPEILFDDSRITYDGLVEITTRRKKGKPTTLLQKKFDIIGRVSFLKIVKYNIIGRVVFSTKFIYSIIGQIKFKTSTEREVIGNRSLAYNNTYNIFAHKIYKVNKEVELNGILKKFLEKQVDVEVRSSFNFENKIKVFLGDKFDLTYDTFIEGNSRQIFENNIQTIGIQDNTTILFALNL